MGRAYEVRKAAIMKTGAAKAKIYTGYAKEIYAAAKKSTDPESNPTLKRLIEKAKKEQVPNDIIKRAIDKVNSGVDESYEKLRYEGFGPSSSTIIIDALTDNVNRTVSSIRAAFSKAHCKLGSSGAVSYMYDDYCILSFKGLNEEQVLEALLLEEVNADIEVEEESIVLYGNPQDLFKIKNAILSYDKNIVFDLDELTTISKDKVELFGDDLVQFNKLIQLLDEIEDVQNVYHNVNLQ